MARSVVSGLLVRAGHAHDRRERCVVETISQAGLAECARIIMEKPFGTDLTSARHLNAMVERIFDDSPVFRIDHFLAKEAAQNILALRFANGCRAPSRS